MDQMEVQNQNPGTNLQLADIVLALQIIKVAAERGVFKAEEYTEVGGCYDRIFKFLEASGAIQRTDSTEAPAASEAEAPKPTAKKAAAKKAATPKTTVANSVAKPKGKK